MPVASMRAEYPATTADDSVARTQTALLDRFEAMRLHLTRAHPASGNEALRLLRAAFPDVPLAERVRAIDSLPRG